MKTPTHPRAPLGLRVIPGHEEAAVAALRSVASVQGVDLSCFARQTDEEIVAVLDAMLNHDPRASQGALAGIAAWINSLTQRRYDA